MKSISTAQAHPIRNTLIAAALAVAVAVPVTTAVAGSQQALATNDGQGTTTTALVAAEANDETADEYCECVSNEEYVESLVGLTSAEKQELLALYNKWDALADEEDLSDADWARICELEDKAWYAEMEEHINSDTSLTDEQRATFLQQLAQMKDLDAYFDAYFSDPTYLEMCDRYDAIYESFGNYLGWNDYYSGTDAIS